ncbi:uncharacterized protein B0H18DRAFT_105054 [Fomitopsis serialis]|uniref:uncharacterized protein n=1 Tax=Fomitopsis serialis TaxID=139415 RepID=UPI00200867FE|nr:uncharacterized protein B0H18DRAFT_105054 [Neoantrodia serialis]KAH9931345.1 hypothetical protein B0H18DRAFT_105054 [Neoantrodia serialis]
MMATKSPLADALLALPVEAEDLATHGPYSQEVHSRMTTEISRLELRLEKLKRMANAILPMHTLPVETLVDVFRFATSSMAQISTAPWISQTMGVCRYWRDILSQTPLFWTTVDLSWNVHFLRLCLARSANANLKLNLLHNHIRHNMPSGHTSILQFTLAYLSVAPLLAQYRSQVSDLVIRTSRPGLTPDSISAPYAEVLKHIISEYYPVLTTMSVGAHFSGLALSVNDTAPNLRRIEYSGLALYIAHLPWSRLTSISLCDVTFVDHQGSRAPALADLLDVLELCTSLEELKLYKWEPSPWSERVVDPGTTVSLPHMQSLRMSGGAPDLSAITHHLSLPPSARLALQAHSVDECHSVLRSVLPSNPESIACIREMRHVLLWSTSTRFVAYADIDRTQFWDSRSWRAVDFNPPWFVEQLPLIPQLYMSCRMMPVHQHADTYHHGFQTVIGELSDGFFDASSVRTLVFYGPMAIVNPRDWMQLLAAYPNIECLEVLSDRTGNDMCDFIFTLAPTPAGVPCPQLRELFVQCDPSADFADGSMMLDCLLSTLQERDEGGTRLKTLGLNLVVRPDIDAENDPILARWVEDATGTTSHQLPDEHDAIQRGLQSLVDSFTVHISRAQRVVVDSDDEQD